VHTTEQVGFSEPNVHFVHTHHKVTCYLVEGDPFCADTRRCTCGAYGSVYGMDRFSWKNLVTTAGALWYMQCMHRGLFEQSFDSAIVPTVSDTITPTNEFRTLELANGGSAAPNVANNRSNMVGIIGSTQKEPSQTPENYPVTDDGDTLNTGRGADVMTYRYDYAAGDFNAVGIADLWITNQSPGASEPILNHADEASFPGAVVFTKTATDTLQVSVNHQGALP